MPILGNSQSFERYQITRWLGSGTAGESYEAEDRVLLRKVTLKLIHPWATLPDAAQRQFFREMQGISTLSHPFLASVLDYGEVNSRLYVARRYVSSGSLLGPNGRLWFHAPLPVDFAFKYAHQLAQVLHYIHQHGYLHGSLSFSNVLVLRGPNLENEANYAPFLMADIGLASFVRRFGKPQVGTLLVSAAPEQSRKQITPASDQFALAVLLYFWLAGRPPYLGTPDEVERLKQAETITPLSLLNPGVTAEQDSIILRALSASPKERHPSVLAFAESLVALVPPPLAARPELPNAFMSQPETPRIDLEEVPFTTSASASEEAELQHTPALTSAASPGDELPASFPPEPSNSAPEELPSTSEPAPSLLSSLPETPRLEETVEETVVQAELAPSSSSELVIVEETAAGPTVVEETVPVQPEPLLANETEIQPAGDQLIERPVDDQLAEEPTGDVSDLPATVLEGNKVADESGDGSASGEAEVTESENAQPADSASFPYLLISSPYTSEPYEFLLTGEETNIGRAGASDLLLDQDDLTSRHHALIKRSGERVLIFDKRSYNGVFINGQKIEGERGYELVDGDHIGVGNYELIFRSALNKMSRA